jgi:predicted DNA-binding protein (MmcQ/YjbR family)
MSVTQEEVDAICSALPGAVLAHPPELISWKVGGKMFACLGKQDDSDGVSVKTPDAETARMLIETGGDQGAILPRILGSATLQPGGHRGGAPQAAGFL